MTVALTQVLVLGLPLAMLLDRAPSRRRLLGLAFLLGSGAVHLVLLLVPRWTPLTITPALLLLSAVAWAFAWKRRGVLAAPSKPHLADLATLLLVFAHARAAVRGFFGEWDFWAIWGLKARIFLERGGIDWAWLEHPWHAFAHPDYPPLLPLNYVLYAMQSGQWDDASLGLVTTLFAAALILIVRDAFERELGRTLAAWATLGVASVALSPWIGLAEAPMIAFGTAGLLFVRRGELPCGAFLLGFAACTKNEGLALIAAVAGALIVSARARDVVRLWPAAAVATPWLVLRALHTLPTVLLAGPLHERLAANAAQSDVLLRALAEQRPVQPELWIAIALAFVLFARGLGRERFVLVAVALQLLFYAGAFLATPYGMQWHVQTSAARLLEHAAMPLAFVALILAGRCLRPKTRMDILTVESAGHAGAMEHAGHRVGGHSRQRGEDSLPRP